MKILAFDPGMNLGYCVLTDGNFITSGCIRNDASQTLKSRMQRVRTTIQNLLFEHEPDEIVIEAVNRVRGVKTDNQKNESTWTLYWVFGEIIAFADEIGTPIFFINPASMKSCMVPVETRSPGLKERFKQATKNEVSDAVQALIGHRKMRSDESDAVGLVFTRHRIYTGEYVVGAKKKKPKKTKSTKAK